MTVYVVNINTNIKKGHLLAKKTKQRNYLPLIVGISLLLLSCLAIIIIVGTYYLFLNPQAKANALMKQANSHLKKAEKIIKKTSESSSALKGNPTPQALKNLADENKVAAIQLRQEAVLAKESLQQIEGLSVSDETKKIAKHKESSADEFIKGIDIYSDWLNQLNVIANFLEQFQIGSNKNNKALALINSAITSANASKLANTKKEASQAKKLLAQAKKAYKQATEIDSQTDLKNLLKAVDYYNQAANTLLKMAKVGKSNINIYNNLVEKLNKAVKRGSEAQVKEVFLKNTSSWVEKKLTGKIQEAINHFNKAEEFSRQAEEI